MTTLVPSFNECDFSAAPGEERVAQLILAFSKGTICWHEVPVGPSRRQPDFILFHPQRGLVVLEVKGWIPTSVAGVNPRKVNIKTPRGEQAIASPVATARIGTLEAVTTLQDDPMLVHSSGEFQGKLIFPWGWGVVLPHITRRQFDTLGLSVAIAPNLVVCRDELNDIHDFERRVWSMLTKGFPADLSSAQVERVRSRIFPEVRNAPQAEIFEPTSAPDLIRVLDAEQERVARSLGSGHRVIHGVAGSGKTLILVERAVQLARAVTRRMLLVTYNQALATRLRRTLEARGLGDQIEVTHFHSWCSAQLRAHRVRLPRGAEDKSAFYDGLINRTVDAVRSGTIPRGQYPAVLIDEGHDFDPSWLELLVQMVDPSTKSLVIAFDDAQAIYAGTRGSRKFSFKRIGVDAVGRTTILRKNYRNTDQILSFARKIVGRGLKPSSASEDGVPLLSPIAAGRQGPEPLVEHFADLRREAEFIVERLQQAQREGTSWREMAVIYPTKPIGEAVQKAMSAKGIPTIHFRDATFEPGEDKVLVVTMHSCKGLEFPFAAIIGADRINSRVAAEKTRLLYVAMTRATRELVVTSRRPLG